MGVSFREDEKVPEMGGGYDCTTMVVLDATELKNG